MDQDERHLVTGGSGFLGRHLLRRLLRQGSRVTTVSRREADFRLSGQSEDEPGRLEVLRGDLQDRQWVLDKLGGVRWTTVFHLAGLIPDPETSSHEIIEKNVTATQNVLDLCGREGVERLIFSSSKSVYAYRNPRYNPVDEEHEVAPQGLYGAAKYASEILAKAYSDRYGLSVIILRLTGIYGMGRDQGAIAGFVRAALRGETIRLEPEAAGRQFDMVHVEDAVDALLLSCKVKNRGVRTYNIGGNECHPLEWFARLILEKTGSASRLESDFQEEGVPFEMNITRAQRELGFSPRGVRQRMSQFIREMKASG